MLEQIKFNLYIGFTADGKCVCNSLDDNDDHFPCPWTGARLKIPQRPPSSKDHDHILCMYLSTTVSNDSQQYIHAFTVQSEYGCASYFSHRLCVSTPTTHTDFQVQYPPVQNQHVLQHHLHLILVSPITISLQLIKVWPPSLLCYDPQSTFVSKTISAFHVPQMIAPKSEAKRT